MRILFFGTYDPAYPRNRVLLTGLRESGAIVSECNSRFWGPFKYFSLFISHFSLRNSYDVMLVAFPAFRSVFVARLVSTAPIIVDAFTSDYEGYVQDRKSAVAGSFRARWYRWLDRTACRLSHACLTDTAAHAEFFTEEYGISRKKLHPIFVGTDTALFKPTLPPNGAPFIVHFVGTYIPLQGADIIVRAAAMLADSDIRVSMVGDGQTFREVREIATRKDADAVVSFVRRVPYDELAIRTAAAQVCLGIFGTTPKTARVIPNKVFEALASARPVITADTPAVRELLDDSSALLVPAGEPEMLARAMLRLRRDPELRERIARAGYAVFAAKASEAVIGRQVAAVAQSLIRHE
jgi:glycosyltransferase involved in cell wall biosynthesis